MQVATLNKKIAYGIASYTITTNQQWLAKSYSTNLMSQWKWPKLSECDQACSWRRVLIASIA